MVESPAPSAAQSPVSPKNQQKLESASTYCAQGRRLWHAGNKEDALHKFQKARIILTRILGENHALTAKTYYWLGFINKHMCNYSESLQAFNKTLRIRLTLMEATATTASACTADEAAASTNTDEEATREAEKAVLAVLKELLYDTAASQAYLHALKRCVALQREGDTAFKERRVDKAILKYQLALDVEKQQQRVFSFSALDCVPLYTKLATCHAAQRNMGEAVVCYRNVLLLTCAAAASAEVVGQQHPPHEETRNICRQLGHLLLEANNYESSSSSSPAHHLDARTIELYVQDGILSSVRHQLQAEQQFANVHLERAIHEYSQAMAIELPIWQSPNHPVCITLQLAMQQIKGLRETNLEMNMQRLQKKCQELEKELKLQQQQLVSVVKEGEEDPASSPQSVVQDPAGLHVSSVSDESSYTCSGSSTKDGHRLQHLTKELKSYQERSQQACEHIAQLSLTITQVQQENLLLVDENRNLQDKLVMKESIHYHTDSSDDEHEQVVALKSTARRKQDDEQVKALETALESTKQQHELELTTLKELHDKEMADASQSLWQEQERAQLLERQCTTLQDAFSTQQAFIEQLQYDTVALEQKCKQAQVLDEQVLQEKKRGAQQLADLTIHYNDSQNKLTSAQQDSKQLRTDTAALFLQIKELKCNNGLESSSCAVPPSSPTTKSPTMQWRQGAQLQAENDSLSNQVRKLESEWAAVEGRLRQSDEKVMNLRWRNETCMSQINQDQANQQQLVNQLAQASAHNKELEQETQVSTKRIAQLESNQVEMVQLLSQAKQDVSFHEQQVRICKARIAELEESNQANLETHPLVGPSTLQSVAKDSRLEQKLEQANINTARIQKLFQETQAQVKELRTEHDEMTNQLLDATGKISVLETGKESYASRIQKLESFKVAMEQELQKAQDTCASLQSEKESALSICKELEMKRVDAEQRLNDALQKMLPLQTEKEIVSSRLEKVISEQAETKKQLAAAESTKAETAHKLKEASDKMELLKSNNDYSASQLTELQAENASLEKQLEDLEDSLAVLRVEHATAIANIETLESTIAESDARLQELQDEVEMLGFENKAADVQASQLISMSNALEGRLKEAWKELEKVQDESSEAKARTAIIEAEKAEVDELLKGAVSHNNEIKSQVQDDEKEIASLQARLNAADSRAASIESSTAETDNLLKEAKITAEEVKHRLTASQQEVDTLREEKENLTSQMRASDSENQKFQNKLEKAEMTLSNFESENESLSASFVEMKARKAQLVTQLSAAQSEATLLREANADLSEQLSATKSTGDQVERNLKEMEGNVSSLRTEAAKISSLLQDKESLAAQVVELESTLSETDSKLHASTEAVAGLQKKNQSLEVDVAAFGAAKAQVNGLVSAANGTISSLEHEKTKLVSQISVFETSLVDTEGKLSASSSKIELLKGEKYSLLQQISALKEEKEVLIARLQLSENNFNITKAEKAAADTRITELEIAKAGIDSRVKALESENEALVAEKPALSSRLEEAENRLDEVEATKASISRQLADSNAELQDARQMFANAEDSLAAKETEIDLAQIALKSSEEEIKALQEEKDSLSDDSSRLHEEKNAIVGQLAEIQEEFETLQGERERTSAIVAELQAKAKETQERWQASENKSESLRADRESLKTRLQNTESRLKSTDEEKTDVAFKLQHSERHLTEALGQLDETMLSLAKKESEVIELAARLDQQQEEPSKLCSIGNGHSQSEGQQSNESLAKGVSGTTLDSLTLEYEQSLQKAEQQITALQDEIDDVKKRKSAVEMKLKEGDKDANISKLRQQNQRAAKVVQELTDALVKVEDKYANLKKVIEGLETNNMVLKKEYKALEVRSMKEKEGVMKKFTLLANNLQVLQEENTLSSKEKDPKDDRPKAVSKVLPEIESAMEITDQLRRQIEFVPHQYESSHATIVIRRPFVTDVAENHIFEVCGGCTPEVYIGRAHVSKPASIEVAAKIACDGSTLFLFGSANVRHVKSDGSEENFGNANLLDRPLGWVSFSNGSDQEDLYSLGMYSVSVVHLLYAAILTLSFSSQTTFSKTPLSTESTTANRLFLLPRMPIQDYFGWPMVLHQSFSPRPCSP
jgi:chromosome segregation ATPase